MAYHQTFAAVRPPGCSLFPASGENGPSDGRPGRGLHVDFPAPSRHATAGAGTRLTGDPSGARAAEVVWNDNPTKSAGGGGFSVFFAKPDYQTAVTGTKRGVPDVSGNGDPVSG